MTISESGNKQPRFSFCLHTNIFQYLVINLKKITNENPGRNYKCTLKFEFVFPILILHINETDMLNICNTIVYVRSLKQKKGNLMPFSVAMNIFAKYCSLMLNKFPSPTLGLQNIVSCYWLRLFSL